MATPQDYGLPHNNFRTGQQETIEWLLSDSSGQRVIQAPTGSGKTAYAKAASNESKVISLCRTKNLQDENYGNIYGFDILKGRANYRCVHPNADPDATANECLYLDSNMHKCPWASECPYLIQKSICKASNCVSLNYAYWLTSKWPRDSRPSYLFLDEAHQLPEIVLDFAGCTITDKNRSDWNLPSFPKITNSDLFNNSTDSALYWLNDCLEVLLKRYREFEERKADRKLMRRCQNLGRKIRATLNAIQYNSSDWYIKSGYNVLTFRGSKRPGFVAKPLTAKYHFPSYFSHADTIVSMSATIGDFETFTEALGVKEYQEMTVPNQFPPESRPIHILDTPRMGRKSSLSDYEKQAEVIANAVLSQPNDWSGLVLTTKITAAKALAKRLAKNGLQDRIFVPPDGMGTDIQSTAWENYKAKVPNAICATWGMWEGYDGLDEKILIVAKVPFPYLGDEFERMRQRYNGKMYLQRTAWQLEQGLGRTRRGREEDYDLNGETRGFVGIADGNWTRIRKYLSQDTMEAIVK